MDAYDKFVELAFCFLRMLCGLAFIVIGFIGVFTCFAGGIWFHMSAPQGFPVASRSFVTMCAIVVAAYSMFSIVGGFVQIWISMRDIRTIKALPISK